MERETDRYEGSLFFVLLATLQLLSSKAEMEKANLVLIYFSNSLHRLK